MAEEQNPAVASGHCEGEVKDRGLFDFMGKKGEKTQEEVLVTGVEEVHIKSPEKPLDEEGEEKKHGPGLLDKLHRSHSSSSSSSSDEEKEGEGENKEKKKKKKGLKEKIDEKLHGDDKDEKVELKQEVGVVAVAEEEVSTIVGDKVEVAAEEEEKKGFLEKIKEKLPGQHKKPAEEGGVATPPPPPPTPAAAECGEHRPQEGEKKGFLEKIKEKMPGYHKKADEEGEKDAAGH